MPDLNTIVDNLKKDKDYIIDSLKKEFPEISDWVEERGIDLKELGHYAKSLAAVALVSLTLLTTAAASSGVTYISSVQKENEVRTLNADTLPHLDRDQEQALEVWNKYNKEIYETSRKYDLDPRIIFSTIMVESRGNTEAIRYEPSINDASYGLGQMLYGTAVLMGYDGTPEGLKDPSVNIDLIGKYHRYNIDTYGNLTVSQVATAYNAGNPYATATYGHVDKFSKWYNIITTLMSYEGKQV